MPPLEPGGGVLSMNIVKLIHQCLHNRVNNINQKNNAIVKASVDNIANLL